MTDPAKAQSTRICQFCVQNICESRLLWDNHHRSLWSLIKSVAERCVFCSALYCIIDDYFHNLTKLEWPLYRWNVRRTARTRETHEVVSVVFRALGTPQADHVVTIGGILPDKVFYMYREEDLEDIPQESELGSSTDCEQSWDQIHKWIDNCANKHAMCKRSTDSKRLLPTRLLDIRGIDVQDPEKGLMRVVETAKANIQEDYVTVSHKWGKHVFIQTTSETKKKMMEDGFHMSDEALTRNFREAILVARQLNKGFVWIDSMCILQDSRADFRHEAPLMHQYYRHSFCNIAAADADSSDGGLFRKRNPDDGQHPISIARYVADEHNKNFAGCVWRIIPADLWDDQLLHNPLYGRGWVFQERMLATRVLHYSRNQIFFECATISACEALPSGLPRASGVRAATDRHWRQRLQYGLSAQRGPVVGTADISMEEFWRTAISTYTRCELTKGTDKVMAIQGVATLVEHELDRETYRDGLWSASLEEQLAWRVVECKQQNGSDSERPLPLRFPSWSWASVDGIIQVQDRLPANDRKYRVRNHDNKSIQFEEKASEDTPDVPQAVGADLRSEPGAIVVPPEEIGTVQDLLSTSPIKIRGYVREGRLKWNKQLRKCALLIASSNKEICEVFPDEPLHNEESSDQDASKEAEISDCFFTVLAFTENVDQETKTPPDVASKNNIPQDGSDKSDNENDDDTGDEIGDNTSSSTPTATYTGIGIVMAKIEADHFYRLGTFDFFHLTTDRLARLVSLSTLKDKHMDTLDDDGARNIYLH